MRLGCVLLVALATFLAACDAVTTSNHATVKLTPTTSDRGLDDRGLLRGIRASVDAADADNEERAGVLEKIMSLFTRNGLDKAKLSKHDFDEAKLSKMMKNEAFKKKMFKNWDAHEHSIAKIRESLPNQRYEKLLLDYLNNFQRKATKAKTVKGGAKVHPAGNRVTINDVPTVREF